MTLIWPSDLNDGRFLIRKYGDQKEVANIFQIPKERTFRTSVIARVFCYLLPKNTDIGNHPQTRMTLQTSRSPAEKRQHRIGAKSESRCTAEGRRKTSIYLHYAPFKAAQFRVKKEVLSP